MCPLDIFKHKKNNSNNLLKDCIHHRLPITETKLISQEDTSATATWQATAAGAQACALWSVPSDQQALWIYKAGLEPSSNSVAKHCPPFPTNKCSAAPQPFPQMSLKLLTITLGFVGVFFWICSKILQDWILTNTPLCSENQLISLRSTGKRKTFTSGWLKWKQK